MSITARPFGTTRDGQTVTAYTLTNRCGASVRLLDYGVNIASIRIPDRQGQMADVAFSFDSLDRYESNHGSIGDTIGRCANRIAHGRFTLDGQTYQLPINHGPHHLHGTFPFRLWDAEPIEGAGEDSVRFHYVSPDGEEGYPGTLDATVTVSWDDMCNLALHYEATTDRATIVNMTNHAYFNLAGHDHGTIRDHIIFVDSDCITAADKELVPTGAFSPVAGTPLDLRAGKLIGEGLDEMDGCPTMVAAGGYDHNYVLRKGSTLAMCASVYHEASGRLMEVITDQPGMQFYSACGMLIEGGKDGATYGTYSGLCLETQHYPDAPNHPGFPGIVLRPGEVYDTTTIYAFRVEA